MTIHTITSAFHVIEMKNDKENLFSAKTTFNHNAVSPESPEQCINKTHACKGFKLRLEVKPFTKEVFNLLWHWWAVASGEKRDCESQKIIMLRCVFDD